MGKVIQCPECGQIIAARFPMHDCKPKQPTPEQSNEYARNALATLKLQSTELWQSLMTGSATAYQIERWQRAMKQANEYVGKLDIAK